MNCDSCGVDIPPAWSNVIARNLCPNCNGPIMSDGTIELMTGLKNALEQMPNDPQGIAGWLLSNYQMRKIGDGVPTEFIGVKPKASNGQIVNVDGIKIAASPLERFQKLAGVKVQPSEKYKALISEINGVLDDKKDEPEQESSNEDYIPEAEDPEYTKKALRAMTGNNFSGKKIKIGNSNINDEEDLSDLHPSLHNDRLIRLAKQRDLDMGGVGIIKRG